MCFEIPAFAGMTKGGWWGCGRGFVCWGYSSYKAADSFCFLKGRDLETLIEG